MNKAMQYSNSMQLGYGKEGITMEWPITKRVAGKFKINDFTTHAWVLRA